MEKTRVFIVEDHPDLLRNLTKALTVYDDLELVGSSQDGEQAVEQVLALKPDLVLLDLELPSLHGIQVTHKIKMRVPEVEVLILTSFDDEQKVFEAIRAGAAGYLVKRLGPDKIHRAIQEVMDGGTVVEPLIAKRFWNLFQSVRAQPPKKENPWNLSDVEFDVLRYVAKGLSNAEVGRVMTLQRRTIRTHLSHIYKKMGVNSHVDAVVLAMRAGIVDV